MRDVKINDIGNSEKVTELLQGDRRKEVYAALGYLSTWAIESGSYPTAVIWIAEDGEITATYREADGCVGYTIGAVWHDEVGRYGFHY